MAAWTREVVLEMSVCGVNEMEKHDNVSRYRRRLGVEDERERVRKMAENFLCQRIVSVQLLLSGIKTKMFSKSQ